MMAANYQHIGGGENRLGRHYSRFSAFWPPAALADQSLALRKSQNAGSNRRSRAKSLLLALTGCVGLSVNTSVVGGTPAVLPSVPVLLSLSSRPEEIHLRALPEPCVTLSSHTAPDVRPLLERLCLVHRLLLFPVGQWPRPNNAAPSLQPHYRAFDATTGCSAPAPRFGTLALAVGAACGLSLHVVGVTRHRFSRSLQEPG